MAQQQPPGPPNPAQIYEDYFIAGGFSAWAEDFVDRARPAATERVLDIACGTGIVARTVARRVGASGRVIGVDLNPAMIEVARATAEREGHRIEWHVGSAESLPFADASSDLVLIQQGVQFFRDRLLGLGEAYRILAPGGRIATSTWSAIENNPLYQEFSAVVERHLGTRAIYVPFSLGDEETLRSLIADAGFEQITIERVRRTVRLPTPPKFVEYGVAAAVAAVPEFQSMQRGEQVGLVEAIRSDMAEPLHRFSDGDRLRCPMESQMLIAYKHA